MATQKSPEEALHDAYAWRAHWNSSPGHRGSRYNNHPTKKPTAQAALKSESYRGYYRNEHAF